MVETLSPQTHSWWCLSSPQHLIVVYKTGSVFDSMVNADAVWVTDRFGCFIKRAFMARTLCSSDTQSAGLHREFVRTMASQHGEPFPFEDDYFDGFHTSAGNPHGIQCYFDWYCFTSSTSRPPGRIIFYFDQRRVPPLNTIASRIDHSLISFMRKNLHYVWTTL